MAKFTQEPWRLLPPAFPHAPYTIQTTVHETGPGTWECETIASVDSEANGRLIAAAPEMYELLETATEIILDFCSTQDTDVFTDTFHKVTNEWIELLARIDGEATNE